MHSFFEYKWKKVVCKNERPYCFPNERDDVVEIGELKKPGIYRWVAIRGGEECLYVGESADLYKRLYQYIHPGRTQETNKRVRNELKKEINKGSKVQFQLLYPFKGRYGSQRISKENFDSKHLRRAIEQAIIFREKQRDRCKLNK